MPNLTSTTINVGFFGITLLLYTYYQSKQIHTQAVRQQLSQANTHNTRKARISFLRLFSSGTSLAARSTEYHNNNSSLYLRDHHLTELQSMVGIVCDSTARIPHGTLRTCLLYCCYCCAAAYTQLLLLLFVCLHSVWWWLISYSSTNCIYLSTVCTRTCTNCVLCVVENYILYYRPCTPKNPKFSQKSTYV